MDNSTNFEMQTPHIFIAGIKLPVRLIMVRSAVACANEVSKILSFDETDTLNLGVAVDEAFCNAVQHFSRTINDDERIHIEFYIEEGVLIVSIRENGIPFDLKQAEVFTPGTLEGMNSPGLGMLLMNKGMDSVELFVHGREGKETRLTKKLKPGAIPEELFPEFGKGAKINRILVKNPHYKFAELEDLPEITRLAWRCYGYSQEELLYDLDLLKEKFLSGYLKSLVFFEPENNKMIAHIGLKYHDNETQVPELGLAFIDPLYRAPGLTNKMAQLMIQAAKDDGAKGVFDCSVTTHTFSQRAMQEYFGSSPCGILMAIAASGMQAKKLITVKQEKGSVVNHYKAFDFTERTVYPPENHREMIAEIYDWIGVPRVFGTPKMEMPKGESSVTVFPLPDELNVAFIIVNKPGEETINELAEGIRKCKRERRDAVYIFLPLGVESLPYLVNFCEKMRFSFVGIMPHIHNGDDRIIFQSVTIPIDTDKIRVYGEKTSKLLQYIIDEQNRIES